MLALALASMLGAQAGRRSARSLVGARRAAWSALGAQPGRRSARSLVGGKTRA
jgi:hypothetical protein